MRVMCLTVCVALLAVTAIRADDDEVARLKAELAKSRAEVDKLRAENAAQAAKIAQLETERLVFKRQAGGAIEQLKPAEKQLAEALKQAKPAAVAARGLRGQLTAIDADKGTVTVDLGSDADLKADDELFVYRLEPEGTYLGKLRIVEVNKKTAVGRFTPSSFAKKIPLKVGDNVADSLN